MRFTYRQYELVKDSISVEIEQSIKKIDCAITPYDISGNWLRNIWCVFDTNSLKPITYTCRYTNKEVSLSLEKSRELVEKYAQRYEEKVFTHLNKVSKLDVHYDKEGVITLISPNLVTKLTLEESKLFHINSVACSIKNRTITVLE